MPAPPAGPWLSAQSQGVRRRSDKGTARSCHPEDISRLRAQAKRSAEHTAWVEVGVASCAPGIGELRRTLAPSSLTSSVADSASASATALTKSAASPPSASLRMRANEHRTASSTSGTRKSPSGQIMPWACVHAAQNIPKQARAGGRRRGGEGHTHSPGPRRACPRLRWPSPSGTCRCAHHATRSKPRFNARNQASLWWPARAVVRVRVCKPRPGVALQFPNCRGWRAAGRRRGASLTAAGCCLRSRTQSACGPWPAPLPRTLRQPCFALFLCLHAHKRRTGVKSAAPLHTTGWALPAQ